MDSCCVVTGQDERGKSVFVQKKPIRASEPRATSRVRFFCARFTGQRNGSITGSKVFDRFLKLVLVGRCSTIWSKSLSSRRSWSPAHTQGTQVQVLGRARKKTAGQPQVLEMQ